VLTAAGLNVMNTFSPVCRPTPVARMTFLRVLCLIIFMLGGVPYFGEILSHAFGPTKILLGF